MADRSVVLRMTAQIDDFRRQMGIAQREMAKVRDEAKRTGDAGQTSLGQLVASARTNADAWQSSGAAIGGVGLLAAAGVGAAIKAYADFDAEMSKVRAATRETAGNMELLRAAAMKAGADTAFSATEAARAEEELAKAGVSTKDVLNGGLGGALALAAAGQLDVGEAAETAASAMTQFGLSGKDIPHIADLLAAGANKAQGNVHDLGEALNQAGLVADQTGLSIEETTGGLAAFAKAGLTGSDAGTSFKTMLQALTPNSAAAAKAMADMGFSAYDSQGNFKGLAAVAGDLQKGLSTMSVEQQNATLKTIFGSDAVRAASILYKEGAAGIQGWIDQVNDTGYAAETAALNMDNLSGDLEQLKGSLETALIGTGQSADGPLRGLVENLTDAVNWYNHLSDGAKGFTLAAGGTVAAVALAGGAFLSLAPKVLDTVNGFKTLIDSNEKVAGGFGKVGRAAGIAAGALAVFEVASQVAGTGQDDVAGLETYTRAILDVGNGSQAAADQLDSMFTITGSGGASITGLSSALNTLNLGDFTKQMDYVGSAFGFFDSDVSLAKASIGQYDQALAGLVASGHPEEAAKGFDYLRAQAEQQGISVDKVREILPRYGDALAGVDNAQRLAGDSAAGLAEKTGQASAALGGLGPAAGGTFDSLAAYAAAMQLDEDATKKLTDAASELGQSLADFVNPLGVYKGLLDAKIAKEKEARGVTDETTGAAKTAWDDFTKSATISLSDYNAELQKQVDAQSNWRTNMLELAGRVSSGVLEQLARLGPEGAPLVAQLAQASKPELDNYVRLTASKSKEATDAWGAQLTLAQPVLAEIGKKAGQGVVEELAKKLSDGTTTVAQIAAQYGVKLANGVNPVLSSLGKPTINPNFGGRGPAQPFADGGFHREDHTAQIAPAGAWRVWAEDETGGEAYIPLSQSKRPRSLAIWRETGRRLGQDVTGYADGGFTSPEQVPAPPSVLPTQGAIGVPATASMGAAYDAVVAAVRAQAERLIAQSGTAGTAGGMDAIKAYIRSVDPLPYVWGGVGPGGFDCTGLAGEIMARATGRPSFRRYFTTLSIGSGAQFGLAPGAGGTLTLGWNATHMAGEYGGLGFEARSTATGIFTGSAARSPRSFPKMAHLADGGLIDGHGVPRHFRQALHDAMAAGLDVTGDPGILGVGDAAMKMPKGTPLNPHVRDRGGPLERGWTYNGTSGREYVLPMTPGQVTGQVTARVVDAQAAATASTQSRGDRVTNITVNGSTSPAQTARTIDTRLTDSYYANGLNYAGVGVG